MRKTLLLFTLLLFGLQGWATTFTVDGVTYTITDATNKTVAIGAEAGTFYTPAINTSTTGTFTIPSSVSYNGDNYAVTAIADYAFYKCSSITSVTIPNTITSIGNAAFSNCLGLTTVTIPSSVTTLGNSVFYWCPRLKSAIILGTLASIPDHTFNTCGSLTSVNIPNSVTSIGNWAFYSCGLTSITIPNPVISIGKAAFGSCNQLVSVNIPSSVRIIGDEAFSGTAITSVTIPNSLTTIGSAAFSSTALTSITIPSSLTALGSHPFSNCTKLSSIIVDGNNPNYCSSDGVLFNKTKTTIIQYPAGNVNSSYNIPSTIISIGDYAFSSALLTSIFIPTSVTSIGSSAFSGSNLTSMSIPNSITTIGSSAFSGCLKLATVNIPTSVTSIGSYMFNNCYALTSVGIPTSVTSIGESAFNYCTSLSSVTIPASVRSIGNSAFYYCTSLASIYANSSTPANITLGSDVFYSAPSTCKLYVPTGFKLLYAAASQWSAFSNITETKSNSVSVSINPSAAGSVIGGGSCLQGSSCILTATPFTGYAFINWTDNKGNIISNSANITFTAIKDTSLIANFELSTNVHNITTISSPPAGGTVSGSGNYYTGTTRTVTATVNKGYTFANWTNNKGTILSTLPGFTFPLTQDTTLTANFTAYKYTVNATANLSEGGSVTGGGTYNYGSIITVSAIPNTCYEFKNWTNNKGYVVSTSPSVTFTLGNDTTLTAKFVRTYDFADANGLYYKISSPTSAYVCSRSPNVGHYNSAVTIPSTVTYKDTSYHVTAIGDSAFYDCRGLESISIPNSVTSIGNWAFYDCFNLASITIPDSVTSIGNGAFNQCSKITSITIPNTITSIANGVFGGCSGLTSITIPNSVTSIGNSVFYACNKLTTIAIPSSVTSIEEYAFYNCTGLTTISIPSSVTFIGNMAFASCSKLASINVDSNNPNYSNSDGVLFNKALTSLIQYPAGKSNTTYTIPSTVTSIGTQAIDHITALLSVTIPNSVSSVGSDAFYYSRNLGSIYVYNTTPANIKLDNDAFYSLPTSACTLYVPTGSKTLYATASQWKVFTNIVELPLYTITASANISTGGNVNGVGSYLSGNQCTISAVPNTGYSFANWTENGTVVSTDASYTFAVSANRTLVANFTENNAGDYTIAMSTNPSVGGSTTGTGRYASGATCIALATANTGYIFSNWTENGAIISKDMTYTFTVSAARTLVANFIAGYTVTAVSNSSTGGSVIGAGGYATGASCTLTATANTGYIFSNWTENGTVASTNATYTFTVNAAHTFIANFVAGFIINATADASQGNITGIGGYATGSSCTLKATPKSGYVFTNWSENGTVVSTNPSYTFTVSAARTLVANFSTVGVTVIQPTATTLSGSIVVTPSTGFTYSLDGKTYQSSNEFPYVSIGTYNVTLKNVSDGTVSSPVLAVINASGVVAVNNYQIKASNCTCRDTKDGAIAVTLAKALDYTVTVTATSTGSKQSVMFSGTSYNLKNLPADTYKLVFNIDFLDNYEQSFNVVVTQPDDLSVLKVGAEKSRATYTLSGGTNYYVSVNDNTTETQGDQVQVSLVPGENKIKIYTEKLCQGVYEETIYNNENGQISLFPNPTTGKITLGIPGEEESVTAEIVSLSGAVQLEQKLIVPASRLVNIDVSDFICGTYIVKLNGSTVHSSVKMIKK